MRTPHVSGLLFSVLVGTISVSACRGKKEASQAPPPPSATAKASASSPTRPAPVPVVEPALEPAPAAKVENEPEPPSPIPDIPDGRSKPPTLREWQQATELNTQEPNSQAENCEMKVVREWLKVYCHGDIAAYSEMREFGEKSKDYFASLRKGKSADFVVRLRRGKSMTLRIQRRDAREAVFYASWPENKPKPVHIALGRGKPPEKVPEAEQKTERRPEPKKPEK